MDAQAVERAKRAAGETAAQLVADGMVLGLGTGSTARWFIAAVARLVAGGMRLSGVPTSRASEAQAREAGIPVIELPATGVDLAVDGADCVDSDLRVIKGAGGAMVREKVVAAAARTFVVVVDESKLRAHLAGVLPVEVLPFGWASTLAAISTACGAPARLRLDPAGAHYVTDNGNLVADADLAAGITDAQALAERLEAIPGALGHGLFLGMTDVVLAARSDGGVTEIRAGGSA
ncbi:MAG TPA: ribose-5-phosphate isomerase RpiA [Candidatus Dormibacteraeota bacterium]|nr:ribose-5-phosphate isomerase RpiA [Candidatus Dormibacteraeota bacterium]